MKRRSFLKGIFAALVASRIALELGASQIPQRIKEPPVVHLSFFTFDSNNHAVPDPEGYATFCRISGLANA